MDEVFGVGNHTLQSFVHFAPGIECQVENRTIIARSVSQKMRLCPIYRNSDLDGRVACIQGQTEPVQGWYAPEFGRAFPNPVVELAISATLPARFGYLLAPSDQQCTSWRFQIAEDHPFTRVEIAILSSAGREVEHFDLASLPSAPMARSNSLAW